MNLNTDCNSAFLDHEAEVPEGDELVHENFGAEQTGHLPCVLQLHAHDGCQGPEHVGADQLKEVPLVTQCTNIRNTEEAV